MKIFDQQPPFESKCNFVDKNNVVVGYDMTQSCCKDFGWYISDKPMAVSKNVTSIENDLGEFVFDTGYLDEFVASDDSDCNMARFRLVSPSGLELFLHLYNSHNGYYSRGFKMTVENKIVKEGGL